MWVWKNQSPIGVQSEVLSVMKAVVTGSDRAIAPNMKMMCLDTQGIDPTVESVVEDPIRRSLYARCSAILLVTDMTESESLKRANSYWFQEFEHYNVDTSIPLFVIGNKSEMSQNVNRSVVESYVGKLIETMSTRFSNSFWCLTSSTRLEMVNGLMVRVQASVVYPASLILRNPGSMANHSQDAKPKKTKSKSPGKDAAQAIQSLKELGMKVVLFKALTCVFQRADKDGDGLLNESELHELQTRCFEEVRSLSEIRAQMQQTIGTNLIAANGMTFPAFLMMMMMGTTQGRSDLVWKLLFGYGYDYDTTCW
eukprot:c9516_g1_i2.p1 GENE.c9516_g1_i2~~c9516_g1_i2.p1  ORF type:complete len:310 (-),score=90.22 c9516_g1_i2:17-946(-)